MKQFLASENKLDNILTRGRKYLLDFVFNGAWMLAVYFLTIWLLVPTSWYFKYDSVVLNKPVAFGDKEIHMVSIVDYNAHPGAFYWNDVLRCNYDFDPDGYFEFIGEWNTNSNTSIVRNYLYTAPWTYYGVMPNTPTLCTMNSTITKYVYDIIPKKQFVISEPFTIE